MVYQTTLYEYFFSFSSFRTFPNCHQWKSVNNATCWYMAYHVVLMHIGITWMSVTLVDCVTKTGNWLMTRQCLLGWPGSWYPKILNFTQEDQLNMEKCGVLHLGVCLAVIIFVQWLAYCAISAFEFQIFCSAIHWKCIIIIFFSDTHGDIIWNGS